MANAISISSVDVGQDHRLLIDPPVVVEPYQKDGALHADYAELDIMTCSSTLTGLRRELRNELIGLWNCYGPRVTDKRMTEKAAALHATVMQRMKMVER